MEESTELQVFDLAEKTAKVKVLTAQIGQNIIEIGNTILEVQHNLQKGDFESWLKTGINYSRRTAYNFMKIAKEFSNVQPVAQLGMRKLLALAGIEAEEREKFIQENDLKNMTVKEVEETIEMKKKLAELDDITSKLEKISRIFSNSMPYFDYGNIPQEQIKELEEMAKECRKVSKECAEQFLSTLVELKQIFKNREKIMLDFFDKVNFLDNIKNFIDSFILD